MPGDRDHVTSLNVGNYFRLTPDHRLILGGRARFSARCDQSSDAQSGEILKASLRAIFPQLGDVAVDYCWGGLVDMTRDRFPAPARPTASISPWATPGTGRRSRPTWARSSPT